ncbi:MAG: DUF512 domain-containing protein [Coriobacteriia bacterium]|nr:DUF512 domain-containing protein [Coriobacteriia bacterium]MBN2823097.1 DUF512 domain-containing protein [Coriobacteriia bacterium]
MAREVYGTAHAAPDLGAVVTRVASDSDAAHAGMLAGDRVLAVDGEPVRDILDWQWLTEEPDFVVTLERDGAKRQLEVERHAGRPLGVLFADILFDGVRECDNACVFCFVGQLPPGLRSSLYVRDDDFRLSFLSGTFVTLTNLTDDDVTRIVEQRLSPLYVSLHAVDPSVRARLVCPTVEDLALERLDELLDAGIEVHAQIVLVPGVNDGAILAETIAWLAKRQGVLSVGVVPLGYTGHQTRFTQSFEDPDAAGAVIDHVHALRAAVTQRRGTWLQLADEFYLNARTQVPEADAYGDFPHYENGIGMVRAFIDELGEAASACEPLTSVTAVTGTLFAPLLEQALRDVGMNEWVAVLPVSNGLLGGGVTVTGLLGGTDICEAIQQYAGDGPFLVPDVVVNSDGLMLDDTPADALSAITGKDVRIMGSDASALVQAVCGR